VRRPVTESELTRELRGGAALRQSARSLIIFCRALSREVARETAPSNSIRNRRGMLDGQTHAENTSASQNQIH
jgi:hypothetical protein